MNLFDGVLTRDGSFRSQDGWIVAVETARAETADRPVVLGIRPEHLTADSDGPIATRVQLVEHLGPETYVYCDGGRSGLICVRSGRHYDPPLVDPVRLRIQADSAHLFDAETGRSLRQEFPNRVQA